MFLASVLLAASAAVTPAEMKALYEEVKTPFKVGAVMRAEKGTMIDNPCVYRTDDGWRMMFIVYDGKGYETHLAKSDDLVHWTRLGLVLERGAAGSWDSAQADGGPALFSTEWGGDNRMRKSRDWYWMTYIGGAKTGYETAPLSISVATAKDNSTADKWLRMTAHPVLSPEDPDVRAFEDYELFRSFVIQDPLRRLGKEFVMYYNAKRRSDRGESIGMAVSDDMLNWRRYGDGAVLTNGKPVPGERGIGLVGEFLCSLAEQCLLLQVLLEIILAQLAVEVEQVIILLDIELVVAPQLVGLLGGHCLDVFPFLLERLEVVVRLVGLFG